MNFFDEIGKIVDNTAKEVGKATNLDPDAIKSAATGGAAGAGLSTLVGGMWD